MQHRGALATILGGRKTYPRLGAVTTVPNQTVTIQEWNATALTVIDWGDGQTTNHPALTGTAVSHIYAVAGTYTIQLQVNPLAVTRMDFRGVGLRVYSAYLRRCVNTVYFRCDTGPLGILNSVDMVDWRPAYWLCFNLPAGFTGVFNFADMIDWRPVTWYCYGLPAGLLPLTVAAANFAGWVGCSSFNISGDTLTQVQVDAVLTGLYSAFATRTATGGTINVGGNNAAPSGVLQAMCPPTTGKERAYELVNDSCGINPTKKWATVTITA